jgi:penicillin-binding protein 1A
VQWTAIVRGAILRPLTGRRPQGGSTITQQLARLLFLTQERTIARKVKEWMTAVRLERRYAKNEILEMYLNQVYYGGGAYGIEAAAHAYFGKSAADLDWSESAVLVGLLPAPSRFSPLRDIDKGTERRNMVLRSLVSIGEIDQHMYDSLSALPITLSTSGGMRQMGDYFAEEIRRYLESRYDDQDWSSEGWSVYTTIDTAMQRQAESVIRRRLDSLRGAAESRHRSNDPRYTVLMYDSVSGKMIRVHKKLQAALVAINNKDGGVLAMVGGYDFAESEFNRATQALRQPGSAFKPFVLTAAVDAGFKPTDTIYDTPLTIYIPGSGEWSPENFDHEYKGPITIRQGYQESRNLVAIKLLQKVEPISAVRYAQKMGIRTPLRAVPSLAIGTSEVTVFDITSAYSVFPSGGIRTYPTLIRKVTDRFGKVIEQQRAPKREDVLPAQTSYIVLHVLKSVIDRGTGASARRLGFTRPAAGKTGTSNEYMDNWFVGFTPQITCGVWVGYDLKTPIGGDRTGTGAATSLPIWTEFMKFATRDLPPIDFPVPEKIYFDIACDRSGFRATQFCPDTHQEVYTNPDDTLQVCPLHRSARDLRREQETKGRR